MAKTKGARYENKGPNVFINKTDIPSPVGIDT